MILLKTWEEIELMRISAQLVSKTLGMLAAEIRPGITTLYLDRLAENFIRDHKAKPGFLGLYDFPNTLCISVNEMVVHGIPNNKPLIEGDIVSIDCGVLLNGFYGDQAYTFPVGEIKPEVNQLLEVTKRSLYLGIEQLVAGNRIGDVSHAIQSYTEKHGYGVVRELVGHGLGRKMHESPEVPNYGRKGSGPLIKNGLVVAIEPMINLGTRRVKQLKDGWTIVTQDSRPSAHYEHNVAVIDGKPEILTTFSFVEEVMEKINN
jgi:methionyl aminopeptidase